MVPAGLLLLLRVSVLTSCFKCNVSETLPRFVNFLIEFLPQRAHLQVLLLSFKVEAGKGMGEVL